MTEEELARLKQIAAANMPALKEAMEKRTDETNARIAQSDAVHREVVAEEQAKEVLLDPDSEKVLEPAPYPTGAGHTEVVTQLEVDSAAAKVPGKQSDLDSPSWFRFPSEVTDPAQRVTRQATENLSGFGSNTPVPHPRHSTLTEQPEHLSGFPDPTLSVNAELAAIDEDPGTDPEFEKWVREHGGVLEPLQDSGQSARTSRVSRSRRSNATPSSDSRSSSSQSTDSNGSTFQPVHGAPIITVDSLGIGVNDGNEASFLRAPSVRRANARKSRMLARMSVHPDATIPEQDPTRQAQATDIPANAPVEVSKKDDGPTIRKARQNDVYQVEIAPHMPDQSMVSADMLYRVVFYDQAGVPFLMKSTPLAAGVKGEYELYESAYCWGRFLYSEFQQNEMLTRHYLGQGRVCQNRGWGDREVCVPTEGYESIWFSQSIDISWSDIKREQKDQIKNYMKAIGFQYEQLISPEKEAKNTKVAVKELCTKLYYRMMQWAAKVKAKANQGYESQILEKIKETINQYSFETLTVLVSLNDVYAMKFMQMEPEEQDVLVGLSKEVQVAVLNSLNVSDATNMQALLYVPDIDLSQEELPEDKRQAIEQQLAVDKEKAASRVVFLCSFKDYPEIVSKFIQLSVVDAEKILALWNNGDMGGTYITRFFALDKAMIEHLLDSGRFDFNKHIPNILEFSEDEWAFFQSLDTQNKETQALYASLGVEEFQANDGMMVCERAQAETLDDVGIRLFARKAVCAKPKDSEVPEVETAMNPFNDLMTQREEHGKSPKKEHEVETTKDHWLDQQYLREMYSKGTWIGNEVEEIAMILSSFQAKCESFAYINAINGKQALVKIDEDIERLQKKGKNIKKHEQVKLDTAMQLRENIVSTGGFPFKMGIDAFSDVQRLMELGLSLNKKYMECMAIFYKQGVADPMDSRVEQLIHEMNMEGLELGELTEKVYVQLGFLEEDPVWSENKTQDYLFYFMGMSSAEYMQILGEIGNLEQKQKMAMSGQGDSLSAEEEAKLAKLNKVKKAVSLINPAANIVGQEIIGQGLAKVTGWWKESKKKLSRQFGKAAAESSQSVKMLSDAFGRLSAVSQSCHPMLSSYLRSDTIEPNEKKQARGYLFSSEKKSLHRLANAIALRETLNIRLVVEGIARSSPMTSEMIAANEQAFKELNLRGTISSNPFVEQMHPSVLKGDNFKEILGNLELDTEIGALIDKISGEEIDFRLLGLNYLSLYDDGSVGPYLRPPSKDVPGDNYLGDPIIRILKYQALCYLATIPAKGEGKLNPLVKVVSSIYGNPPNPMKKLERADAQKVDAVLRSGADLLASLDISKEVIQNYYLSQKKRLPVRIGTGSSSMTDETHTKRTMTEGAAKGVDVAVRTFEENAKSFTPGRKHGGLAAVLVDKTDHHKTAGISSIGAMTKVCSAIDAYKQAKAQPRSSKVSLEFPEQPDGISYGNYRHYLKDDNIQNFVSETLGVSPSKWENTNFRDSFMELVQIYSTILNLNIEAYDSAPSASKKDQHPITERLAIAKRIEGLCGPMKRFSDDYNLRFDDLMSAVAAQAFLDRYQLMPNKSLVKKKSSSSSMLGSADDGSPRLSKEDKKDQKKLLKAISEAFRAKRLSGGSPRNS